MSMVKYIWNCYKSILTIWTGKFKILPSIWAKSACIQKVKHCATEPGGSINAGKPMTQR